MSSATIRYPPKTMIAGTLCRVDKLLGVGGMATVYQVTEMSCGRQYAFKHLNSDLRHRTDLRRRFVAEGKLLGRLHGHPNIVEVITQGVTADECELPFIVMELLNGPNIRRILAKHGRLEPSVASLIMADVLGALEHAHERGVVHRDVKPDNVVSHRDSVGKPKITVVDFGIHREREDLTRHRVAGTPLYMAPELFDGRSNAPPHLADIYAAGIMLYELLTGATPFDDEPDDEGVQNAHRARTPAPPSKYVGVLPARIEGAVLRALEKDPAKRWPDAFRFMYELRLSVQGQVRAERSIDVHSRITAQEIPTQVGTPVDQRFEDRTDPGPPSARATQHDAYRNPLSINDTTPSVPDGILQMQIAGIASGERATNPAAPRARTSLARAPMSTGPVRANEAATSIVLNEDAEADPDKRRLSRLDTQTGPGSALAVPTFDREPGRRSRTPLVSLPAMREDWAAPERIRQAAAQALSSGFADAPAGRGAGFRGRPKRADEPDRIWLDEETALATLAVITDSSAARSSSLLDEWIDLRRKLATAKPGQSVAVSARQKRLLRGVRIGLPIAVFLATVALGTAAVSSLWFHRTRHADAKHWSDPDAGVGELAEDAKGEPVR
jgi:serine/threonine protein kinase